MIVDKEFNLRDGIIAIYLQLEYGDIDDQILNKSLKYHTSTRARIG